MTEYEVPNYIALAIPFFFVLIFLEILITRLMKRDYYRIADSINDLSMGSIQQITGLFVRTTIFASYLLLYDYLYNNFRLVDWGLDGMIESMLSGAPLSGFSTAMVWKLIAASTVGFLLVDLAYYWFHRTSHEVAVVWGSHEAHHQSEEYNLTVALRQGFLQFLFSWPFNLPIALVGIHPVIFIIAGQFNTIYQFWIHTRAIKKLPRFIEWFLNTPSHHRVHHAIDPKYIDRNHAGTLIIWDKMFGTFQAEEEEPHYGTVKPLASWNPIWAQVQYWVNLSRTAYRAPYWVDKFKIWFMRPGWKPRGMGEMAPIPEIDPATYKKYDPQIPAGLSYYGLLQFVFVILGSLLLLNKVIEPLSPVGGVIGAWVFFSLMTLGLVLEGGRAGYRLEWFRQGWMIAGAVAVIMLLPEFLMYGPVAGLVCVACLVWLSRYRPRPDGLSNSSGRGHLPAAAK